MVKSNTPRGSRYMELVKSGISPAKAQRIVSYESRLQAKSTKLMGQISQRRKRLELMRQVKEEKQAIRGLKREAFRESGTGRFLAGTGRLIRAGVKAARKKRKGKGGFSLTWS